MFLVNNKKSLVNYLKKYPGAKVDIEKVRKLSKIKGSTNMLSENDWTSLMYVIADSNQDDSMKYQLVEILLSTGADVNLRNHIGRTALSFACQFGYPQIVQLLIEHNADVTIGMPLPLQCAKNGLSECKARSVEDKNQSNSFEGIIALLKEAEKKLEFEKTVSQLEPECNFSI